MQILNATGVVAMTALTIRNLLPALADALDREKRRRGRSLNQTVIDLLGQDAQTSDVAIARS